MPLARLVYAVGWLGSLLLIAIVARTLVNGAARRYPWFAAYAAYVFGSSVLALWIHGFHQRLYPLFYWSSEVLALPLGVAVCFELLRRCFQCHSGVKRIALAAFRIVLVAVVVRVLFLEQPQAPSALLIAFERDLRALQAVMLAAVVILCLYYSVRLDRNVTCIMLGYGGFICGAVINLALRSQLGVEFQAVWTILQPAQYLVCEIIWLVGLWRLAPLTANQSAGTECGTASSIGLESNLRRLRSHMNLGRIA